MDHRAALDRIHGANFHVNPSRLSAGVVHQHFQIPFWRIDVSNRPRNRSCCDFFHHLATAVRKTIFVAFTLASLSVTALPADRHIAFERTDAVYIANLDGTNEKKIADGIFPVISPEGTRVAFNTVEKTSDTSYLRLIAIVDVATGKIHVFKNVPSENSCYSTWT